MKYKLVINPIDVEDRQAFNLFVNNYVSLGMSVRYCNKYFTIFEKNNNKDFYSICYCKGASNSIVVYVNPYKDMALQLKKENIDMMDTSWNSDTKDHLSAFSKKEILSLTRSLIYLSVLSVILLIRTNIMSEAFSLTNLSVLQMFLERYSSKFFVLFLIEFALLGSIFSRFISIHFDRKCLVRVKRALEEGIEYSTPKVMYKRIYYKNFFNTFFVFASILNVFLLLLFLL